MSPAIAALVPVQTPTGLRPGEVAQMTRGDLNTEGEVWEYRLQDHGFGHLGKSRVVMIGPRAQEVFFRW
jgi:integrase